MVGSIYESMEDLRDFVIVALGGGVGYDVDAIAEDIAEPLGDGRVSGRVGGAAFDAIAAANYYGEE